MAAAACRATDDPAVYVAIFRSHLRSSLTDWRVVRGAPLQRESIRLPRVLVGFTQPARSSSTCSVVHDHARATTWPCPLLHHRDGAELPCLACSHLHQLGVLLQQAILQTVAISPWLMIPALPVIVAVIAFNFLGDGLRDAADPYGR